MSLIDPSNQRDFTQTVQEALGGTATPAAAQDAIKCVFTAIRMGLLEDREVKIARFGSFRLKTVRERSLLLPGTQQKIRLPRRRVVRFHVSPLLRATCGQKTLS